MATIQTGTQFVGISSDVSIEEKRGSAIGSTTEVYTADDLLGLVVNTTTSALSLATLNSTYGTNPIGTRVVCRSISAGGLVYTKTAATAWVSQSVTAVS